MINIDKKIVNLDSKQSLEPSMFYFFKDPPNICSLTGLMCALLGIYFAILGNFHFALIGILWTIIFDWLMELLLVKLEVEQIINGYLERNLTLLLILSVWSIPGYLSS